MNSMPQQPPAEGPASENWSPDFRAGYAEGYLACARIAAQPLDPDLLSDANLEALLAAWGAEQ